MRALGIEVRAGLHTGECELVGDDIGGMAVHIGARISALAQARRGARLAAPSRTSSSARASAFADRGEHELKGVPGEWRLFALGEPAPAPAPLDAAHGHMRASDRVVVSLARRAPRAMRLGARLASR